MTRAMKENTPFRIAFCVLCHKYTPVLAELVHQLDAPGNGLFIHVDGKADIGAFAALGKTGRVCFVEPRTKVYWGGFGMVESTLRLFSATRDGGFRYVVLISGDTLPLYPAETIRTVLREAYDRGRQFISANPSITPEEADRIRRRRFRPPLAADRHEMHHACGQSFFRPAPAAGERQPVDCNYGSYARFHLRLPRCTPRLYPCISVQPCSR